MHPTRIPRRRQGVTTLILIVLFLSVFLVMGLAVSRGSSSNARRLHLGHRSLETTRAGELALDEMVHQLRSAVNDAEASSASGGPSWFERLRQPREGVPFTQNNEPVAFDLPLSRAAFAESTLSMEFENAYGVVLQQYPFRLPPHFGGYETYGTVLLGTDVAQTTDDGDEPAEEVRVQRLVEFRTVLRTAPAPFDSITLMVRHPHFVREELENVLSEIQSQCELPFTISGLDSLGQRPVVYRPEDAGKPFNASNYVPSTDSIDCASLGDAETGLGSYLQAFQEDFQSPLSSRHDYGAFTSYWNDHGDSLLWRLEDASFIDPIEGRATHRFATVDEFLSAVRPDAPGAALQLAGIYYIDQASNEPLNVDWEYRGWGMVVTPAPLRISAARRKGGDDTLVLISTQSDVTLTGPRVEAGLFAPHGAVVVSTADTVVEGQVFCDTLEGGFDAAGRLTIVPDPRLRGFEVTATGTSQVIPEQLRVLLGASRIAQPVTSL